MRSSALAAGANIFEAFEAIIDALSNYFTWFVRFVSHCMRETVKHLDRGWVRRYRRALARSKRNNRYLESIGRCR